MTTLHPEPIEAARKALLTIADRSHLCCIWWGDKSGIERQDESSQSLMDATKAMQELDKQNGEFRQRIRHLKEREKRLEGLLEKALVDLKYVQRVWRERYAKETVTAIESELDKGKEEK